MLTVKICGLTSAFDAMVAAEAGADYLGFVFAPGSPRSLSSEDLAWIRALPFAAKVGVFCDQSADFIWQTVEAAGLAWVQLHGAEPPSLCAELGGAARVIKAIQVADRVNWELVRTYAPVARILFDAGAGSGGSFPWELLRQPPWPWPFWLAGGLRPDNVAQAIAACAPAGVDVSSGVESAPGRKDPAKVRAFLAAAKGGWCEAGT